MQTRIRVAGTCRSWRAVAKDTMFNSLWRCHGRLHHPLQMFGLVGPQLLTNYDQPSLGTATTCASATDIVFTKFSACHQPETQHRHYACSWAMFPLPVL